MAIYYKFDKQTMLDKITTGKYKNLTCANRAIGKTDDLSAADKAEMKLAAKSYFSKKKVRTKKTRAKSKRAAPKATLDARFKRPSSFVVTFLLACRSSKFTKAALGLARAAIDADLTLPELVDALEAV